ncbi:PrsW family intramembrane metalloprotease [Candidatus Parcubacteria bacterium]|nr:PrsW family intramembrane metalloprotease [Candidatus Parcubacteria bacterium]
MLDIQTIIYALIGGVIPAFIWLAFWLYEDYKNPEPRGLILKSFLMGMIAVVLVIPLQKIVDGVFPNMAIIAIILWVILEEVFKLGAGYLGGIKSREDNEPLDPLIYMITAALGFVALENTLFVLGSIVNNNILEGVLTGNLRFIGASLLHVVSSGIIGTALSFTFYQTKSIKRIVLVLAIILATIFHTIFNILIIYKGSTGGILAFGMSWIGVILLLVAFEKIKTIAPERY